MARPRRFGRFSKKKSKGLASYFAIFPLPKLAHQRCSHAPWLALLVAPIYFRFRVHHRPAAMGGMRFCAISWIFVTGRVILLKSCRGLLNRQPSAVVGNA